MHSEQIARARSLTRDDFEGSYLRWHEPVVLEQFLAGSRLREWSLAHLATRAPATKVWVHRRVLTDPRDASRRDVVTTTVGEYAAGIDANAATTIDESIRCALDEWPELAADVPECALFDRRRLAHLELYSGVSYSTGGHAHPGLHTLLCHVEGDKDVVLYSPHDGPHLYANSLFNEEYYVSRADFMTPDLKRFPRLSAARRLVTRLAPGDALYIPTSFWHAVRGVGLSTSVSYFWRARRREEVSIRATMRSDLGWVVARAVRLISK